ncbi:hypothetical protein GVv1_38150 [Enterobacter pseudoroggenkampii]
MPMLPGGKDPVNPARSYLLSLNFARSWLTRAASLSLQQGQLAVPLHNGRHGTPARHRPCHC